MKAWGCENLVFMNVHNYTQMKYTIENFYRDMDTGRTVGYWQMSPPGCGAKSARLYAACGPPSAGAAQ